MVVISEQDLSQRPTKFHHEGFTQSSGPMHGEDGSTGKEEKPVRMIAGLILPEESESVQQPNE